MTSSANRGEWAELYALSRLITMNTVAAVDRDLKPIPGKFYKFLELLRKDDGTLLSFVPYASPLSNSESQSLPDSTQLNFLTEAFLGELQTTKGRAFESPIGEKIMRLLGITTIKASSREKVDLYAKLAGLEGADDRELGFSIKSQIGGASTLLNASGQTIFRFSIVGGEIDADAVNAIDTPSKIKDRVKTIYASGGRLEFESITSAEFANNMDLIESTLKANLANMLVASYRTDGRNMTDLIRYVSSQSSDPTLGKKLTYQVKNFLRAVALGMVPGEEWTGDLAAYGGYLVILPDGKLGCFHLQKDDAFKDYLINHTKLDTPSSRSGFGFVEEGPEGLTFSLNLQIRFI
jgi:type II restriction enzyme